jgi:predicted dinucleotide-binding enzyme
MVDIVIVGGCGHVGLPLGLAFARAGNHVVAFGARNPLTATRA